MGLLDKIKALPAYRVLLTRLEEGLDTVDSVQGLGLPRSARLPLVACIYQDLHRPIILISNRADRALALFEELQFWMDAVDVHYFPEPNPLFYEKSGWGTGTRRGRSASARRPAGRSGASGAAVPPKRCPGVGPRASLPGTPRSPN